MQKVLQNLQSGCSKKIPHEGCSTSAALQITNTLDGFLVFCHKCRYTKFIPHYDSQAERIARNKAIAEARKESTKDGYNLPADFSLNLPSSSLSWLGRSGWTLGMISEYRVGWSESLKRTILPLSEGYTARSTEAWLKPKYLEKAPETAFWRSNPERVQSTIVDQNKKYLVLTEDILSAGRTGEYLPSIALCGTDIGSNILELCMYSDKVILWLDQDTGGINGLKKIHSRIALHTEIRIIKKPEPKLLNNTEIQCILQETLSTRSLRKTPLKYLGQPCIV